MRPDEADWRSVRAEWMPEDVLALDLIHRAVRRIFEGEGEEQPTAPSVRVVNFSIGGSSLPFARAMSPFARLVDWLAWTYPALWVISAGNQGDLLLLQPPTALDGIQRAASSTLAAVRGGRLSNVLTHRRARGASRSRRVRG